MMRRENTTKHGNKPKEADVTTNHVACPSGWSCKLVAFDALPPYLQDNEYLLHHHRPQLNSFTECTKSVFRLHTETMNIWTHLLALVFWLVITYHLLTRPSSEVSFHQKCAFLIFLLCSMTCFAFSSVFHACGCHSLGMASCLSKLDYAGVILMIVGCSVPWLHFAFYCSYSLQAIYVSLISVLGLLSLAVVLQDKFCEARFRSFRAGLFVVLGLSAGLPFIHYTLHYGVWESVTYGSWLVFMAALYIVGAAIYGLRIPERMFPGKCDIWGSSHQIMHVFIFAGSLAGYYGMMLLATHCLNHVICDVTSGHQIITDA